MIFGENYTCRYHRHEKEGELTEKYSGMSQVQIFLRVADQASGA